MRINEVKSTQKRSSGLDSSITEDHPGSSFGSCNQRQLIKLIEGLSMKPTYALIDKKNPSRNRNVAMVSKYRGDGEVWKLVH